MKRNILLTIEYDGTDFSGWQRQPNVETVQGVIEKALSLVCGKNVLVDGTSRTDAGVHAFGQRASFQGDFGIPTNKIMFAVNNALPKAVRIVKVEEKPLDFHARFDCVGKEYVYKINVSDVLNPFERNFLYQIKKPLDIEKMQRAAEQIIGTHDFKCFQAAGGEEKKTTVRTIKELTISSEGNYTDIRVIGDGFLYNMVRIIVGTLIDVSYGKIPVDFIKTIIEKKDRTLAGHTAPPQGLYLSRVFYEEVFYGKTELG